MHSQLVNKVTCTVKVKIPDAVALRLDSMFAIAQTSVKRMLADRAKSSSKYYPELPCVIAKSLIAKYQRNRKLKAVSRLVLPICGDKGRQIKWDGSAIRIPAIFGKEAIPVTLARPPVVDEQGRVNLSGESRIQSGTHEICVAQAETESSEAEKASAAGPRSAKAVEKNQVRESSRVQSHR